GWYIGQNGDFFITNETDTFTGHGGPPVTVFDALPPYPHDLGIPAAPGHYDTTRLFGFTPPPAVTFHIQVTQLPQQSHRRHPPPEAGCPPSRLAEPRGWADQHAGVTRTHCATSRIRPCGQLAGALARA